MGDSFTVIQGNKGNTDKIDRMIEYHECWHRQYQDTISKAKSKYGNNFLDFPQEDLMKIVLSGIKMVNYAREIRREYEKIDMHYRQTLKESQVTFNLIDALFTIMSLIKLKNLVTIFPIRKDYDGEKWECKDYFYTMDVLSGMDWDKPVGRDKISDLLWDYQNDDLRYVYVEYMCATSAIYRSQTGKGLAEQWCEDLDIPTYTVNDDAGIVINNQTGQIAKLNKRSHLQIIK